MKKILSLVLAFVCVFCVFGCGDGEYTDEKNVKMAFELGCTVYSGKPIDQDKFEQVLKKFGLI